MLDEGLDCIGLTCSMHRQARLIWDGQKKQGVGGNMEERAEAVRSASISLLKHQWSFVDWGWLLRLARTRQKSGGGPNLGNARCKRSGRSPDSNGDVNA